MKNSSGNVLFLILIAVALFAALSYAVTQSTRSGGGNATSEQVQLRATQLITYMTGLQNQVVRMRITDGVDALAIHTGSDVYTLGPIGTQSANCWNDNTNCVANKCHVFNDLNPEGTVPRVFGPDFVTPAAGIPGRVTPGHLGKRQFAINGIGTPASDLTFYIAYIRADVCNAINAKMGMTTNFVETDTFPPGGEEGSSVGTNFGGCGTPAVWDTTSTPFGDQFTAVSGQQTFCIPYDTASPGLALFQVIIDK